MRCRFGLSLRWQFTALGIENNADHKGGNREACAEFGGPKVGKTGATRLCIEKGLHKEIVAGVQEYAGPNTAGLLAHPGEEKADSQHHHRKAHQGIPQRAAAAIVCEQYDWVVPKRPDGATDHRDPRIGSDLGKLGDEKSAPAELFAQRRKT